MSDKNTFLNPYDFLSISRQCVKKNYEEYIKDAKLKGYIECSLENKTELIIPGKYDQENKTFDFYKDINKKPAIPGSTLRGLIRSIHEIIKNSCLSTVNEDTWISKRSGKPKKLGFLKYEEKKWFLYEDTIESKNNNEKPEKVEEDKLKKTEIEEKNVENYLKVVKKYKEDNIKNEIYKKKIDNMEDLKKHTQKTLLPVYYSKVFDYEKKKFNVYLSHLCITKEFFYNKIHDILKNSKNGHDFCKSKEAICPSCALFGTVVNNKESKESFAIESRVRFESAQYEGNNYDEPHMTSQENIPYLSSPEPAATEFYLKKPFNAKFWNYDYCIYEKEDVEKLYIPELSGRKYYLHRNVEVALPGSKKNSDNKYRILNSGGKFKFRVYFENISETEVVDLIISLNFGKNDDENMHKIGLGKPYGYGSVKIKVDRILFRQIIKANGKVESKLSEKTDEYLKKAEELWGKMLTEACIMKLNKISKKNNDKKIHYPLVSLEEKDKGKIYKWFEKNRGDKSSPKIEQNIDCDKEENPLNY